MKLVEREKVKVLLIEAITLLCQNAMTYQEKIIIDGLLGITLDSKEVFLIKIDEQIKSNPTNGVTKTKERLKVLVTEAVRILCQTCINYQLEDEFTVEGLIGITLHSQEVLLVKIDEKVTSDIIHSNNHEVKGMATSFTTTEQQSNASLRQLSAKPLNILKESSQAKKDEIPQGHITPEESNTKKQRFLQFSENTTTISGGKNSIQF